MISELKVPFVVVTYWDAGDYSEKKLFEHVYVDCAYKLFMVKYYFYKY